ncbi:MAG: hypothetical protein EZS28_006483 [Streblomastix strix]|uniref:tRNA-guanine(15) transglycosylase-like domain-containing protein n=1 Tax=Streblomastix strix TaxID=222440 RepID=A0A5J4WST5_9EUKA|nr:MAG: hypothetical protein EZS28_006483 [Streblomastix strix]
MYQIIAQTGRARVGMLRTRTKLLETPFLLVGSSRGIIPHIPFDIQCEIDGLDAVGEVFAQICENNGDTLIQKLGRTIHTHIYPINEDQAIPALFLRIRDPFEFNFEGIMNEKFVTVISGSGRMQITPEKFINSCGILRPDIAVAPSVEKETQNIGIQGVVIGGLNLGESSEQRKERIRKVMPLLDPQLPRVYVGSNCADDIIFSIIEGIDIIDSRTINDVLGILQNEIEDINKDKENKQGIDQLILVDSKTKEKESDPKKDMEKDEEKEDKCEDHQFGRWGIEETPNQKRNTGMRLHQNEKEKVRKMIKDGFREDEEEKKGKIKLQEEIIIKSEENDKDQKDRGDVLMFLERYCEFLSELRQNDNQIYE